MCKTTKSSRYCVSQTDDEKAVLALNEGDYATAQSLLEGLIAKDPTGYFRYPRLAAVYAYQAGFSLVQVSQLNTSGSENFLDQVGSFLPTYDPKDSATFRRLKQRSPTSQLNPPSEMSLTWSMSWSFSKDRCL